MPWRKGNRLRLVTEEQADGETRRIYAEIRETLGLHVLHLFYPALGVYPTFLKLHWESVKRIARSQELFSAAERLRADSYTRTFNYFQIPDFQNGSRTEEEHQGCSAVADYYHLKEPLILLLFCLQMQAMEGPVGSESVAITPQAAPEHSVAPAAPVDEFLAAAALKKKFEEIRRTLGVPFVNSEFCSFANWPGFLDGYWEMIKRMVASPLYDECRYGVRATAWTLASQLPGPVELTTEQLADAGMPAEEIASVARILELFVTNLSGQLLNVAAAKIALEGGNAVPRTSDDTETDVDSDSSAA